MLILKLRNKIRDICLLKSNKTGKTGAASYAVTECELSETCIRKVFNAQKRITPEFLGKICVGLKLTPEESEELFLLNGHTLEFGKSYFESITMYAMGAIASGANCKEVAPRCTCLFYTVTEY